MAYDKKLTIIDEVYIAGDVKYIAGFAESGATLPTDNIATGSNIFNIDDEKLYYFHASSGTWVAESGDEGGGSGD